MAGPNKTKNRRRRIFVVVAVALAIATFFVLSLIAGAVKDMAEETLAEKLGGTATIDALSISLLGTVRAREVLVVDASNEPIVAIELAELDPHILPFLSGKLQFDARIERPQFTLRQDSEGGWSIGGASNEAKDSKEPKPSDDPAQVYGTVRVSGGTVRLIGREAQTTIDQLDATLAFDGPIDQPIGECTFGIESQSGERGRANAKLHADRDGDPKTPDGMLELVLDDAPLSALDAFLSAPDAPEATEEGEEPRPRYTFAAPISGTIALVGAPAKFNCRAELTSSNLRIAVDGQEALRESSALVTFFAVIATRRLDVSDLELQIVSNALSGTINGRAQNLRSWLEEKPEAPAELAGLSAQLMHRPDAMNPLVAPWFPDSIDSISRRADGPEQEPIAVDFPGPFSVASPDALLAALRGTASLGLGHVETEMIDGDGGIEATFREAAIDWEAKFATGDGALVLAGTLDPAKWNADAGQPPTAPATLTLRAKDVEATSRLSPVLALVHPAFATLNSLEASSIAGLILGELDLSYDGPLSKEVLSGGLDTFPTERLRGSGSFGIAGAVLRGAPALEKMLAALGVDADEELHVRPVRFSIDEGRIQYLDDWTWTIGKAQTTFTGSVGFDQSLDLNWNLPVTDAAVDKYGFLKSFKGRTIRLPIGGTASDPKLDWRAPLGDVAKELTGERLLETLGVKGRAAVDGETSSDPAALYDEANRLWDAGSKVEAAEIYRKIRAEHQISLTYALNRDRIKKRAKYQE